MLENYKPIKWITNFNEKYGIKDIAFTKKNNKKHRNKNGNHYYNCLSYIFKNLELNCKNKKYLDHLIKLFGILNNEDIEQNFQDSLTKEIDINNDNYDYIMDVRYYKELDKNVFLLRLHFNRVLFLFVTDFIIELEKLGLDESIEIFLKIVEKALNERITLSEWSINVNSDMNSIYHITNEKISINEKINNILFDDIIENEHVNFFDMCVVIHNIIKLFIHFFIGIDYPEHVELLDGNFNINTLIYESKSIMKKYNNLINDYNYAEEFFNLIIIEETEYYIILPFKNIKSNYIPNIYWLILLNGEFIEGENEIIIDKKIIKYEIKNYKEIKEVKKTFLKYDPESNNIDILNYGVLDKKHNKNEVLNYMDFFFRLYQNNLHEQINSIEDSNIKKHLLYFMKDENYKKYNEINIKIKNYHDFDNEISNNFIIKTPKDEEKKAYKKLIGHDGIIFTKYDEFELLYWYIPLLVSFYVAIGIETTHFNSLLYKISHILSHSLSFTKNEEIIKKNMEIFHDIIINSINNSFDYFKEEELNKKKEYLDDILNN